MKLTKARRLSLLVPVTGWEAYISTKRSENTREKVANVSADGASNNRKTLSASLSTVALSIKPPVISFSVIGMVVRNDPYAVAVLFLNHSASTRVSLLTIISKLLAEKKSNPSGLNEAPIRSEQQSKLNLDAEQECFHASGLMATAPRSETPPGMAECNSTRSKDNNFMISSAQTHSAESL